MSSYHLIQPGDLSWRPSNMMQVPNADFLERTGSKQLGARLWRLPPKSANTLHRHVRSEEFFFVVEGVGRMRINGETITIQKHGGVWVGVEAVRQIFNDGDEDTLWLIVSAPEEDIGPNTDWSQYYPADPKALPPELNGVTWPPKT